MNIQSAIIKGTEILTKYFISLPYLESEILMTEAINKDKKYLLINSNKKINEKDLNYFKKLIKERSKGKPIAYIINKKYFWNSEFLVSRDTLIPRPDTEIVVECALNLTKNKTNLNILDIGVGTGCILLSVLKERKSYRGTGIDISKNCLKLTKINAINLNVAAQIKLYKTNIDKFTLGKYDLILSNPPYIESKKIKYLDKDVVSFEPKMALDGGIDGLSEISKVIKKSSELIKKNGVFILEIGFDQKNKVINLLKREGFYINCVLKDLSKNDRCIICKKI